MSIFKESFRKFVKRQLGIREAIVSRGNEGHQGNGGGGPRDTKFKTNIKIDNNTFDAVNIPAGAFYTYQQKTCVIRMASGTDLNEKGAEELATNSKYYKASQLKGSGLARRYILQGGTLAMDRTLQKFSDKSVQVKKDPRTDKIVGMEWEKGYTKTTRRREEAYSYSIAKRQGIIGTTGQKFGTAYGDPSIASEPGRDDYGAVPMPGITSVNIRTKSAYGSLREAKVKFICHSRKQLEALELLYMRPGIPILLEWGWTNYIDNDGKRVTNYFPFDKTLGKWFIREYDLSQLNTDILEEKILSGGNYDGMNGMCKNFKYTARPDGGYDCETEIIGMGEILESLKGEKMTALKRTADAMELGLDLFEQFSTAVDETTNNKGEDRWGITNFLYFSWKALSDPAILGGMFTAAVALGGYSAAFVPLVSGFVNAKRAKNLSKGEELFPLFRLDQKDADGNFTNLGDSATQLEQLKKYILTEDQYVSGERGEGFYINQPFIRWDALCFFINDFVINKDAAGKPLMTIQTVRTVHEDEQKRLGANEDNAAIEPFLYTRLPRFSIPYFENGVIQRTEVYEDDTKWYNFGLDYNGSVNVNDLVDMSVNPAICITPNQVAEGSDHGKFFDSKLTQAATVGLLVLNPVVGLTTALYGILDTNRRTLTAETGPNVGAEYKRIIGHIYLNIRHLQKVYRNERYDDEGNPIEDFNLFDYLKKIWDGVTAATGNTHNFILHNDIERPNQSRVIDLQFQEEEDLEKYGVHELKIQSNDSICRNFQYDSTVPSALSTTIATSVQNPDNATDLDQTTFAALNRNIRSRFHVPKREEERQNVTSKERRDKSVAYDKLVNDIRDKVDTIFEHRVKMLKGKYAKTDDDGDSLKPELVGSMARTLESVYAEVQRELTLYPYDGAIGDELYYKGFKKKEDFIPKIGAVIPLKFKAELDGISGIVIGNVFTIDPSRLPVAYASANVGFVTMKESQDITAGGDWNTKIEGHLIMLPGEEEDLENTREGGYNHFWESTGVNYLPEEQQQTDVYQGVIDEEQRNIDPEMDLIRGFGEPVFIKLGRNPDRKTSVRASAKVNNERLLDFGSDNMIGVINNRKGLFVGICIGVTQQEQMSNLKFDQNEGQYVDINTGELVEDRVNKFTPWYYIQFAFRQRNFYKNFNLGSGYNANGELDSNGADDWRDWWSDSYNLKGVYYHRNKCWKGEDQEYITGRGFMRIDVVQANASYGMTREECINIIATEGFGWRDPVAFTTEMFGFESSQWTLSETYALAQERVENGTTTLMGNVSSGGQYQLEYDFYSGTQTKGDEKVPGAYSAKHSNAILILQGFNKNATDDVGDVNSKITITDLESAKAAKGNNPYGTTDSGEPTPYEIYMAD